MVRYRRNLVPSGTFFFTVVVSDRRSSVLVDNIDELRASFRAARERKPFTVEAIVILPDHLHAILTLPPDDSDFAGRWRAIKATFTRLVVAGGAPTSRDYRGRYDLWQRRFWEHPRRGRFRTVRRLHSLQSSEARASVGACKLEVFILASLCSRGRTARRLGWQPLYDRRQFRRASGFGWLHSASDWSLIPAFRCAPCGLRLTPARRRAP
jgi:REP element-mobilizing transposase RayT